MTGRTCCRRRDEGVPEYAGQRGTGRSECLVAAEKSFRAAEIITGTIRNIVNFRHLAEPGGAVL